MGSQKITMTITSTGGCTVTVDGTATWEGPTLIPPRGAHNFGFKGKLTFGGSGAGCPTGTMEFRSARRRAGRSDAGRGALVVLDADEPGELREIAWHTTDPRRTALLNDRSAIEKLSGRLRAVAEHDPPAPAGRP